MSLKIAFDPNLFTGENFNFELRILLKLYVKDFTHQIWKK